MFFIPSALPGRTSRRIPDRRQASGMPPPTSPRNTRRNGHARPRCFGNRRAAEADPHPQAHSFTHRFYGRAHFLNHAGKLGVHETQVSRDERNEYHGITLERAARSLDTLGADLRSRVELSDKELNVA
jgi:hypothetical protein